MQTSSKTDWERVKREAAADAPIAREPGGLYDPNDPAAVDAFFEQTTVRRRGERGGPPRHLLAEPDGRRVHEVGPPRLEDRGELGTFRIQGLFQLLQRLKQGIEQLQGCQADGGRDHVVG